jgi:hypothetical protein
VTGKDTITNVVTVACTITTALDMVDIKETTKINSLTGQTIVLLSRTCAMILIGGS